MTGMGGVIVVINTFCVTSAINHIIINLKPKDFNLTILFDKYFYTNHHKIKFS